MTNKGYIIFVVVGRLPQSLVKSKVEPIIKSDIVDKVYIFSQEEGFKIDGVEYITLPKIFNKSNFIFKLVRLLYEPIQLFYFCLKYNPDLINGIYVMPKGFNSLIISKIYGCKCIVSNIGGLPEILTYYNNFKKLRKSINLFIYRKADYVTTKGYKIIDYLVKEGVSKSNIDVFNGSIDTDRFCCSESQDRDIDILFVGSFIERKGPNRVVEMIEKLKFKFKNDNIKAMFLGKGELTNSINDLITKNHLESNISVIGHVDNTEDYFKRTKVLVMPSISEGLSTAMLEAMSSGCVPVVSDVGEMTKAAIDRENSFVIKKYDDIQSFSEKINILLIDDVKRNNMAQLGREIVVSEYSTGTQVNQFNLILRRIFN